MPNVNSSSLINDHRHLPTQFVTHVLLTIIKILCVYKTIKFRKFEVIVERTVQWSSSPFRHSDSLWSLPSSLLCGLCLVAHLGIVILCGPCLAAHLGIVILCGPCLVATQHLSLLQWVHQTGHVIARKMERGFFLHGMVLT